MVKYDLFAVLLATFTIIATTTACMKKAPPTNSTPKEIALPDTNKPIELLPHIVKFQAEVESKRFTTANCAEYLNRNYQKVFHLDIEKVDLVALNNDANLTIKKIWEARLALRNKLKEFTLKGNVPLDCVDAVRHTFRAARFMEDYIGEMALKPAPFDENNKDPIFEGEFPKMMIAPGYKKFDIHSDLKSGDVILSRGAAFSSAAIARLGDIDTQFSHLSLVYIDPATDKKYTIEAHIEVGVVVAPFSKHLEQSNVRAALFRHPDGKLAHNAAKFMYDLVSKASATGRNIPYDFQFKLGDHSEIFCSEVITYGFYAASGGKFHVPMFESQFTPENRFFLDKLGIKEKQSFEPADIEVDPRFELITEWRDYSRMKDSRMKDAALTLIFEWMEREGYIMHPTAGSRLMRLTVWNARRWPIFRLPLKNKFPKNMTRDVFETIILLNKLAGKLYEHLERSDQSYLAKRNLSMSAKEMYVDLEKYREWDMQQYLNYRAWKRQFDPMMDVPGDETPPLPQFHMIFHPPNL